MKKLIWGLQAAVFYLFTLFVSAMPAVLTGYIGTQIGRLLYNILHSRRSIAIDNIRQALPFMKNHPAWTGAYESAEEIARATFIHLGISIVEICRLYHGKGNDLIDRIEVRGLDNFQSAAAKNKGVLCIGGHCGNWELSSLSFKKYLDVNVAAIARKQNNPYLHTIVEKVRMGYGNRVIYTKTAAKQVLSVLKQQGVIGMLIDQAVFEDNGALIDFLGRKAWANKAPAVFAHKTGSPLVPVYGHREADRYVLTFHPEFISCGDRSEAGIHRDIQEMAQHLEEYICAHPADWYWVHRRWKRAGQPV